MVFLSRERSYFLIIPPVHLSNMKKKPVKNASNNILKHNDMHEEVLMLIPWSVIGGLVWDTANNCVITSNYWLNTHNIHNT